MIENLAIIVMIIGILSIPFMAYQTLKANNV